MKHNTFTRNLFLLILLTLLTLWGVLSLISSPYAKVEAKQAGEDINAYKNSNDYIVTLNRSHFVPANHRLTITLRWKKLAVVRDITIEVRCYIYADMVGNCNGIVFLEFGDVMVYRVKGVRFGYCEGRLCVNE